jgi:hypothetical protein
MITGPGYDVAAVRPTRHVPPLPSGLRALSGVG